MPRTATTYDLVRCTDSQWNNMVMQALASRHFHENPDCNFVEVWEHAGWSLGFRRDGSIWSTANDQAQLDSRPKASEFSGIEAKYPDLFCLGISIYNATGGFAGHVLKMAGAASVIQVYATSFHEPGVVYLTEAHVLDMHEKPHHIQYDPTDGKWKEVA